jgi:hypothetical protein
MDKLDKIIKEIEKEMNNIKKLPPEERLREIEKLEKIRKEEMEKAEALREESMFQMEKSEKEREEEEQKKNEEESEERKRGRGESLEEEVSLDARGKAQRNKERIQQQTIAGIYQVISAGDVYSGLREIRNRAASGQSLTDEDERRIRSYGQLIESGEMYRTQSSSSGAGSGAFENNLTRAEEALKQIEAYKMMKSGRPNQTYQSGQGRY